MITQSIRIDDNVYAILQKEASSKSASINNSLNQILDRYVEFDRFVVKFQFLFFHRNLVLRGLEGFDEKDVRGVGSAVGAAFAKDAFLTIGLPFQ